MPPNGSINGHISRYLHNITQMDRWGCLAGWIRNRFGRNPVGLAKKRNDDIVTVCLYPEGIGDERKIEPGDLG